MGGSAGGLLVEGGTVVVEDTLFQDNTSANSDAAGMAVAGGKVNIRRCRFVENHTHTNDYRGGGLHVFGGTVAVIDTLFLRNRSAHGGGADVSGGSVSFERCTFEDNIAKVTFQSWDGNGGGLSTFLPVTLDRCVFTGNRAEAGCGCTGDGRGGAWVGPVLAEHCTLLGNFAFMEGGGAYGGTLHNSIVWGNTPSQLAGSAVATWSDVEGGWSGTGNIAQDALLFSEDFPDVHLRSGSPCIDAGDPASPLDPDGSRTDMGAFPFDPGHVPSPKRYCTAKVNSAGCAPAIGWSGTPTLSGPDDFVITADEVLGGQFGLMFWGPEPLDKPFFGGTRCVGSPVRTTLAFSGGQAGGVDCSGSFSFHLSQAYMSAHGIAGFSTIYAQWWYRDPGLTAPDNVGLSDGLAILIVP